ncbi:hypothetical protein WJX79_004987 [Trebouxia sp. C0005]
MIRDAHLAPAGLDSSDHLGPISASPQYVAEALVYFANLNTDDILFDLGCNDGRVVTTASRLVGLKGVGVEIDSKAAAKAQHTVIQEHLQDRVSIICGNALESDLSTATAVFLYLLPKGMSRLLQKLQAELQPGCKVITYMFRIPDWQSYHQNTPSVFESSEELGDITGLFMIDDEGEFSTVDVQAKFVNGKPDRIEAKYIMRSAFEWDRFMRYMERYAEQQGLGFQKSK